MKAVPESNEEKVNERRALAKPVEDFVRRALALDDDDLSALAAARGDLDEAFHLGAWRSANEIVARDPQPYIELRHRLADVSVPRRLVELTDLGAGADPEELARWMDVARLARIAVDDALMGLLGADSIPPPDLRELFAPWKAMLFAAHRRTAGTE